MGTITSGIGLISGLDFGLIVDQLIAIEARPLNLLLLRIGALAAPRTLSFSAHEKNPHALWNSHLRKSMKAHSA